MLTISMQDNAIDDWSKFLREFSSNRSVKKLNLKVARTAFFKLSNHF